MSAYCQAQAQPLTTLTYHVNGTGLQVSPAVVSVPKGIAGSVMVTLTGGEATQVLAEGAYVEAFLRGPGFPEPRRIVSQVNQPMLFPPLNLVGDYQLDSIRLVDAVTGATRMEGNPAIVPVRVFDEILVSRVTSRPLTYEEIVEKGIFIDESNFRVVEFEAAFVLDGKTIPILFPVVAPKFKDSIELIPAAELEEKLAEAAVLNRQIASTTTLPPEFEVSQLNIEVQGINFQVVDPGEDEPLGLNIPPIPALMVIPGNIGFLNQFFSVMIFTENAAPTGSGLSVYDISATLKLPAGPDRVVSTNYTAPGDDPLRFARIGPDKVIQPVQQIVQVGRDGELGTTDDNPRLQPGQSGQAEFLVEGLQEGLHVMDLDLEATMDGLAAGPVRVKGKAAGSVLVRNPRFSMAFSHPRTVRVGEPYEASVTLLNTGITPANLVQISLNKNSISGARLESDDQQTVELGTLMPGESKTATFKLRSLRNGAVSFSNLTTSDDSVVGRFRFSMGVDERGVALSPDTLAMPDQVNSLPPALLFAANRVLGQALSIATAGQVPPGVTRVGKSIISRRVLDLAEAGQRLNYGDPAKRVYADLMRDWQGGREASAGFDQILRETEAGREWRTALFAAMEAADGLDATARIAERGADYAGLGQEFAVGSANNGQLRVDFGDGKAGATMERSTQPYALIYGGTNGVWANTLMHSNAVFIWTFTNGPPVAEIAALLVSTNGTARQLRWTISNPPVDATYSFALNDSVLRVDLLSDGALDSTLPPAETTVSELPPQLIAVEQDLFVIAGRPSNPCIGPAYRNYGQIVAVVFSKPMTQDLAGDPNSYTIDGDNGANSVSVQPGGRVAYLNLRKGISAIRPRALTLAGVTDVRGNVVTAIAVPIRCVEPGSNDVPFTGGVAIRGRALKGDGAPAPGIPVTLTMYDQVWGPYSCEGWVRRVSQVFTDSGGNFDFDFVLAGVPYSISATDTSGLTGDALSLIAENTVEGQVEREKILQLATSASTRDTLLGLLSSGSIPEAIAKVEGLDRALVRDSVAVGSPREGQTVPIALRFRGRATVVGQVVAADGTTPLPRAAVNLFPDSGSRELGRGIFADGDGRFAFYGVPLGVYTVEVQTSDRRNRTVAGLLDTPGQVASIVVALPDTETPQGGLRGTVYEADNLTPHGGARVFIGQMDGNQVKNVVRIVDADADGNWHADGLPVRNYDVVAISFDGKRKGVRRGFGVVEGAVSVVNVTMESTTLLFGRVQYDDGRPATNALVAGGLSLVRTDVNGNFEMEGVPVGNRTISAGLERNPAAGIDFPRLGSATVNVIEGAENYVVVKLRPAGKIFGRVTDLNGRGIGGIRVAIPVDGGFYWTDADGSGNYVFENLGLGSYTLSAPANATSPQLNLAKLNEQIRSGNEDEILAAFEEAIRVFVGADDPLVTGEQNNFRPITWGFTNSRLQFDGQTVEANIRMLREGTVAGRVVNHQGVPIGARVRLNGIGPDKAGAPKITIRGERDSDPATGLFIFPRQLLTGPWTVQAASPFYPTVIQVNGFTTDIDPNVTNVVLQFPPIQDFNGRLVGQVFNPDGTLAGDGVRVKISFSDDYEIQTDEFGFFDTQIAIPAGGYRIEAIDDESGLRGEAYVRVNAGITNQATVQLLTRNSTVEVNVVRGNGLPAAGARVDLEHGTYPREAKVTLFADTNGFVRFTDLWEGRYAVRAEYTEGSTKVSARGGVTVAANQTGSVALRLGGTGSIAGQFVKLDQTTPVDGAQVSIGNLGFASTGSDGRFRFDGVPLGTYQLTTSDPVTGAFARGVATVTVADQVVDVLLIEGARGEINGHVIDSYGQEYVAGATVKVNYSDGLTPSRTVTTGPDGRFNFPGSPVGNFTLSAKDRLVVDGGRGTSGSAAGSLNANLLTVSVNVQLQPLGTLPVKVVREDGVSPASNVTVRLATRQLDTDETGSVRFENLGFGNYTITAISRTGGELRNGARISAPVAQVGTNPVVTIRLPGVGAVRGVVVASDGVTPVSGAEVVIVFQSPVFSGQTVTAVSAANGSFEFTDVPVGDYRVTAASVSLAASAVGSISAGGEADNLTLRLGDSGVVAGRLVRTDGVSPVEGIDVLLTYASQSSNPGRAFVRSRADGTFEFSNIPVGNFNLEAVASAFGGLIKRTGVLTANGQRADLGTLIFDEEFPRVLSVLPADTTDEVPIATQVRLEFSEALAASSITTNGVFIRSVLTGVRVSATLQLLETNGLARVVTISPRLPLVSEQVYEVVVIAGELLNGTGGVIGAGPRDLVGRALTVPFVSRFRTADNDLPVLLSLFPSNNAVQIDPRGVPRLSFNESLRPTGFDVVLSGPGGLVAGTASVGVDGRVLSFVPVDLLQANATYTLTISNVFDLAGNRAAGEPYVSIFKTLDTVGPRIVSVGVVDGRPLAAGATVPVEAVLETGETGVTVRYTQDFQPIGSSGITPFRRSVTLPASGSTTIRAIATDQYGNDGPVAEVVLTVQPNQPPTIAFSRVTPLTGPILSGSFVAFEVTASDDSGIAELKAVATGFSTGGLVTTNGRTVRFQGVVPVETGPGSQIQIFAEATDDIGQGSGQQTFALEITDGTKPVVSFSSPAAGTVITPGSTVPLTLALGDNFGVAEVNLTVAGAFATEVQRVLSPLVSSGVVTLDLTVPAGTPAEGGPVSLSVTVKDAAGNVSTAAARSLRMNDGTAPQLLSVSPVDGATGVDPLLVIRINFSEALDSNTVVAANFLLEPVSGGEAVPVNVRLEDNGKRVVLTVAEPLALDATFRLTVGEGVADVAGNSLGSAFTSTFRTGDFRIVQPAADRKVVEGVALIVEASSPTTAYETVRFLAGGVEFARDTAAPFVTNYVVPTIASLGTNRIEIIAQAVSTNAGTLPEELVVLAQASVSIEVFAGAADTDGDGISNADEIARGWDPFTPNLPPVITGTNYVELVEGHPNPSLVSFSVEDSEAPTRIWVRESLVDDAMNQFDRFVIGASGQPDWDPRAVMLGPWANSIELRSPAVGQTQIYLRAMDPFGLMATNVITVVTLADLDGDSIADRDDPDVDGDGLSNTDELARGTDPRKPDTDGDGRSDFAEINGTGGPATDPLVADTDGDGLPDGFELALSLSPTNGLDGSSTVVISNRTVSFSGFARFHTLILTNGAVLTHDLAGTGIGVNEPRGLELVLTNLIIDSTSRIDVSAKGYLGGLRDANVISGVGRTIGNRLGGGSPPRNGGSYGGMGGSGSAGAGPNATYGSFRDPNEFGSGGGSDSDPAGNGGGLVRISVGSAEINGQVLANGGAGSTYGGPGSGGGIRIVAETLSDRA
ncbi:MAG: carboxypeptidase regulatory-like domain-containing protein [Verrucomicrobia bacterium]|nr:carboxypeptidase regulatory-like domain-containing protein [Verrucomicrobiota bacterium]